MIKLSALKIFGWLLWRDMRVLKIDFINTFIDAMIIPATFIIISGYILPYLGMPMTYGSFMIVSTMLFMAFSTATWRGATYLVQDIEGDRAVSYELTLPLPSWMVFVKFAFRYALNAIFVNIFTLPLGKILLWNQFDLSQFHVGKFILIYIAVTLFFGFFALWIASWVRGMVGFSRFWLRYGSQLLFFSGYQFPWEILNKALPAFSYVNLLNPFVYAFEGTRASVLGQEGNLPFWICFLVLVLYSALFGYCANRNFKQRLDCL
jgi:ABC-2 type transport system permease protein